MQYTLRNASVRLTKLAAIMSQVLHIDVEIADRNLFRITGTGKMKYKTNQSMVDEGHAYSIALKTGTPQIIRHPGYDPICCSCPQRAACKETFEISYPIKINGEAIGIIGLIAYTKQQQQRLEKDLTSYCGFLEKISSFISFELQDLQRNQNQALFIEILSSIFEKIDLGVLAIDESGRISMINDKARFMLNLEDPAEVYVTAEGLDHVIKGSNEYQLHLNERHCHVLGNLYQTHLEGYSNILIFSECRLSASGNTRKLSRKPLPGFLLGRSPAIQELRSKINQIAYFKVNAVIYAEPGLEVRETAQVIHAQSVMGARHFTELNCAAYSCEALRNLLFSPGGLIEKTAGQTLFLRNIEQLPLELQLLLSDALDSNQILLPDSGRKPHDPVRILCSSGRDLEEMVREGSFYEPLYYLLSTHTLRIPPLREREADLVPLAKTFLQQQWSPLRTAHMQYSAEFIAAIQSYSWPGNLPQLKKAMVLVAVSNPTASCFSAQMLPPEVWIGSAEEDKIAKEISPEQLRLQEGILRHGSTLAGKQALAEELGISIATLYRKLRKYDI